MPSYIFLPGFFACLVPFCSGVGFGCAALAEVFWASFSRTDRGTVGMGGSFSLHDSPSASVSAFVILRNKGEKKSFERLILCVFTTRECSLMDEQCILVCTRSVTLTSSCVSCCYVGEEITKLASSDLGFKHDMFQWTAATNLCMETIIFRIGTTPRYCLTHLLLMGKQTAELNCEGSAAPGSIRCFQSSNY